MTANKFLMCILVKICSGTENTVTRRRSIQAWMTAWIKENCSKHGETLLRREPSDQMCFVYQKPTPENKEEESSECQKPYLLLAQKSHLLIG